MQHECTEQNVQHSMVLNAHILVNLRFVSRLHLNCTRKVNHSDLPAILMNPASHIKAMNSRCAMHAADSYPTRARECWPGSSYHSNAPNVQAGKYMVIPDSGYSSSTNQPSCTTGNSW